jgi:hypothetical protein
MTPTFYVVLAIFVRRVIFKKFYKVRFEMHVK